MHPSPPPELPRADLPRLSPTAFIAAWAVFWLLMATVSVQDFLRQGRNGIWQPLLWEGSSCLVASAIAMLLWGRLHRLDRLLDRPWLWFGASLAALPVAAAGFVAAVFGLRHAVYAALGATYRHEPWAEVFQYESVKFSLFYLLVIAVLFGLRSHAALGAERMRAERLRALTQEAQLLQLTQQIEPHFLFNALNTIASAIATDPELADTLLLRLAALLRAATDLSHRPQVELAEELRLLEAYTTIMQERFAPRVALHYDIDPASTRCQVPTLALQPLVENAFRHGIERHAGPGMLAVRSRLEGGQLVLEVHNDPGTLAQPLVLGTGLSNLRRRLALHHGERATLDLAAAGSGGVLARVCLPCVY